MSQQAGHNLRRVAHCKVESHYGPGGRNCPCCGPAPSERKAFDRSVKRGEKRAAMREAMREAEQIRMILAEEARKEAEELRVMQLADYDTYEDEYDDGCGDPYCKHCGALYSPDMP